MTESAEGPFSESGPSLPPPPKARRRLALFSLLVVGLAAWLVMSALLPSARFALQSGTPEELGALSKARLDHAGTWVHARGKPADKALSFRRRGSRGSFRLTQVVGRPELWLVLAVPEGLDESDQETHYVPPSHFTGRLLPLDEAGIHDAPIVEMIWESTKKHKEGYLLLDGDRPSQHYNSLFAAIALGLLGAACLGFAGRLVLRSRS